jgi:hypothetical protein
MTKETTDKRNADVSSFEWKGMKILDENGKYKQNIKKLVDMTASELGTCYDHCKTMLFNQENQNPGRYLVLEIISDQKNRCGAELFLRFLLERFGTSRFSLINNINAFLTNNKLIFKDSKPLLKDMFSSLPSEFEDIPLSLIMDGCLDKLGSFNKKHITRTFILKQGVWLTPTEIRELLQDNSTMSRLETIKEHLGIKDIEKLYINDKGINYTQMRGMLNLKNGKKYSDLTTNQLETLRNRILFALEESVKSHIESWEERMMEIEKCATFLNYKL